MGQSHQHQFRIGSKFISCRRAAWRRFHWIQWRRSAWPRTVCQQQRRGGAVVARGRQGQPTAPGDQHVGPAQLDTAAPSRACHEQHQEKALAAAARHVRPCSARLLLIPHWSTLLGAQEASKGTLWCAKVSQAAPRLLKAGNRATYAVSGFVW